MYCRIIATVLDFSGEERGRTGLEGGEGGWLGGILGSRSRRTSTSQVTHPPARAPLHLYLSTFHIHMHMNKHTTGPIRAEHSPGLHSVS